MALSHDQIKELLYWFVTDSETRKQWSKTRIDALEENHKWIQPSVIEKLSDEELKKKFLDYYNSNTGYKQNINKLYRDRIIRDVGDFRKTINFLLDEKINIIERLDGVLEGDFKIEGFGKGILTAFLMDFDPDKYCLWNQKTEKGLEVLGWEMHKKGDSPGIKYQKVLGGLQRIRELRPDLDLGFVDVDLFLHTISAEEEGMEKVREFAGNEIVQASSHYWQIAPGEKARLWDDVRNNSIAAVGYDEFNFDVTNKSNNELFDLYKKHYSDATDRSISIQITQLLHFLNLKPGDKFVTNKGRSLLLGLGIVKGTYKFRPDRNEYRHTIDAEYYKVSESGIPIPESLKGKFGKTIVPLTQDEFETLERLFEGEEKDNAMLKEWYTNRRDKMNEQALETDELEFEEPLEEEIEKIEVTPEERKIFTDKGDPEVDSLHKKWTKGKLVLQPDFQRHFVWDAKKSSRLIESGLLDIPLPIVYLSEGDDGKEYVIDGQQRLTAFFSFINGKFLDDDKDFKLTGLRVFTNLNGETFKGIDEDLQDKILYCKIRTITFKKESDKNLRFEIFERLNTGAVSLNDQELRNCIYRGPYNKLLNELSKDKDFMYLLGLKTFDKRMRDVELVLRFAGFHHTTYLRYKPPMRTFLNNDMEKYQNISEKDAAELRSAFKNTITIIRSLLVDKDGNHAFKRFYRGNEKDRNGYWESKKFNASLYDILMWSFAQEDKNKVYQNLDAIREALIHLMTDDKEFIDSIELSTSSIQAVTKRFDKWRLALQDIIGIKQKEPRCFSLKIKEELYNNDPTCTICGQKIQKIDDSAVDHIEQYWTGGKTIPENARLTHRYCNWARSRKE